MRVVNYTEFRSNLAESLNALSIDSEIVVVLRCKGKNVVVMSLDEYNGIQETLYLNSTTTNCKRLEKAIKTMNDGMFIKKGLIEG